MLRNRVIPALLLSDGGLVKTCRFEKPKYVGDPINAIRIFNEKEVDELIAVDIGASRAGREPDYDLIGQFASECFMPLCYGGGIATLDHAHRLFALGVEKVALQSSAIEDSRLIQQIAGRYGSQAVVISVDLKRDWRGRRQVYWAARRRVSSGLDWKEYLKRVVDAGAGEILLTSVDREGTMSGMDLDAIREAAELVDCPLIAQGGVASLADIRSGLQAGASAVAVGAFFVFHGPHRAVLITYPSPSELEEVIEHR